MRTGLIAAGLAIFAAVVLFTGGAGAKAAPTEHTCSATDIQFIRKSELNMTALGTWTQEYREGAATEAEIVDEARKAARRIDALGPRDPSLRKTKQLLAGMLVEYGRAMAAKAKNRDAAPHMYRAYGLANFAHEVLTAAAPELGRRGCDVSGLL